MEFGEQFSYSGMRIKVRRKWFEGNVPVYFAPTAIFALISLVSFSIDLAMVPGRLGLLVTLYLIMTNVYMSNKG